MSHRVGNESCFIRFGTFDAMTSALGLAVILQAHLPVNATIPTVSKHGGYARELFSVEGERVTLDAQRGWQCTCTPKAQQGFQCAHVEQAQTLRKRRGVRPEPDTIELQFSTAQLQDLSRAALTEQTIVPPPESVAVPKGARRHSPWATVAIATAMSAVTSGITYLATARAPADISAEPQGFSQALATPPRPQPVTLPPEELVKIANPFDATESFEFPPGTSLEDARQAVADFLLNRARARQAAAEVRLRNHKSAQHERLKHAMRLAEAR